MELGVDCSSGFGLIEGLINGYEPSRMQEERMFGLHTVWSRGSNIPDCIELEVGVDEARSRK